MADPRPSNGAAARIGERVPGVWDVWWEDYQQDDFDDVLVRIEVLPVEP